MSRQITAGPVQFVSAWGEIVKLLQAAEADGPWQVQGWAQYGDHFAALSKNAPAMYALLMHHDRESPADAQRLVAGVVAACEWAWGAVEQAPYSHQQATRQEATRRVQESAWPLLLRVEALKQDADPPTPPAPKAEDPPAPAEAPAAPNRQPVSAEAVEAFLGDGHQEAMRIARDTRLSADDRMRQICRLDRRLLVWNSTRWGKLLGVSAAAVRKTHFWLTDRPAAIEAYKRLRD
jgi:hypothetical protein